MHELTFPITWYLTLPPSLLTALFIHRISPPSSLRPLLSPRLSPSPEDQPRPGLSLKSPGINSISESHSLCSSELEGGSISSKGQSQSSKNCPATTATQEPRRTMEAVRRRAQREEAREVTGTATSASQAQPRQYFPRIFSCWYSSTPSGKKQDTVVAATKRCGLTALNSKSTPRIESPSEPSASSQPRRRSQR
jgi:hypothetical protein